MREETIVYKIYKFSELSDEAKQNALEKYWDWNVSDEFWYEYFFDEAKGLGFEITSFDLNHHTIEIKLNNSPAWICKKIIKDHGETCDTYKLAKTYLEKHDDDPEWDDFQRELGHTYSGLLLKHYEYLTSEEAIIESIEANEVEFHEDGRIY